MKKVAIVGAGPSGLVLAKQLKDRNIQPVIFERDEGVGGVWNCSNMHSVMYDSAHTISSKTMTEFSDFPMPEEFSEYISHRKMLQYLQAYADRFDLLQHIQFACAVKNITKTEQGSYVLDLGTGDIQEFDHVAVATGHASKPKIPDLNFDNYAGEVLHTQKYKEPSIFKNKKVLVIGAGNSGCDIACEATSAAKQVFLSIRRGYYFIPKFLLGMPADVFGETTVKLRLPMFLRQKINQIILRFFQGNIQKIGFPKPDHRIFESHPIVNELLIYHVRHGDITIRKDVKEILSNAVKFSDGSLIDVDVIVLATGYEPDFVFLHENLRPTAKELYLNLFSKKHYGLTFPGLLDPNGGILGILESQAKLLAMTIAQDVGAEKFLSTLQKNMPLNGGVHYVKSARHEYEVEHATYRRKINKQIKTFEALN